MIGLLRADLLKLTRRKVYWVMLAALAFFVALAAFFLLVFPGIAPEELEGLPVVEKPEAYNLGVSQVLGQTWFPVILAVVFFGTETGGSIWPATLTFEARRWLHLVSRTIVLTVASWVAALAAVAGWALVAALLAPGSGAPPASMWLSVVWKAAIVQVAWVAVGLAAVSLVRSMGPAVGIGLGVSIGESLLALWRPWQNVSLTGASTRLAGDLGDLGAMMGAPVGGISLGHAVVVVVIWGLGAMALAAMGLQVRDP